MYSLRRISVIFPTKKQHVSYSEVKCWKEYEEIILDISQGSESNERV